MDNEFVVISANIVDKTLNKNPKDIYSIIKSAYLLHQENKTINPSSYFLRFPEKPLSRIIALPAYIGEDFNIAGIKWISSNPLNIGKGLPRASAVLILNDYETGFPIACIEGSIISATRTAVSAVLAAEHLNKGRKIVKKMGFIGSGLISSYVYKYFLQFGWDIGKILVYDKVKENANIFLNNIHEKFHTKYLVLDSANQLISQCDLVVIATTSLDPYIKDLQIFDHNPIILNISLRDMCPSIILNSTNVVDDIKHVLTANTSLHLAQNKYKTVDFINGTLAQLINKNIVIKRDKPIIFSPMGLGVLDIALGKYVFDTAMHNGEYVMIPNFFPQ